jgi:hypothetical protein
MTAHLRTSLRDPSRKKGSDSPFAQAQAVKEKKRAAVYEELWKDPRFLRLEAHKDKALRAWNQANAFHTPDEAKKDASAKRALRALNKYIDLAMKKAGCF